MIPLLHAIFMLFFGFILGVIFSQVFLRKKVYKPPLSYMGLKVQKIGKQLYIVLTIDGQEELIETGKEDYERTIRSIANMWGLKEVGPNRWERTWF